MSTFTAEGCAKHCCYSPVGAQCHEFPQKHYPEIEWKPNTSAHDHQLAVLLTAIDKPSNQQLMSFSATGPVEMSSCMLFCGCVGGRCLSWRRETWALYTPTTRLPASRGLLLWLNSVSILYSPVCSARMRIDQKDFWWWEVLYSVRWLTAALFSFWPACW